MERIICFLTEHKWYMKSGNISINLLEGFLKCRRCKEFLYFEYEQ